jgi:predicted MFS family arabinose efflux permease
VTKRYPKYALTIIFFANFLSYLDRQLVSALEEPLRKDLRLDLVDYNLLWTLFTVGYMICAPFIGFASDRYRRPRLFACCIFIWSLATIASGMATTKEILYVSRVLIGLGEAGCLIIGSALISDFFGKETRGRALSIFYSGLPLGGTCAFILAGLLLNHTGWRNLFFIAGVPGFLVTVLIWMMIDPPRGGTDLSQPPQPHGKPGGAGFREYLQLLRTPTLMLVILAQAFAMVILVPLVHNGVGFFQEYRGMGGKEAKLALGIIALIAGCLGNGLSGILGDRLRKRFKGAYALLAGVSFMAAYPCLLVGFTTPHKWIFLPALTLGAFFIFLCMPAVNAQIANSARPTQRAMAWALAVFILHLLGDTFSPPIFGMVGEEVGRLKAFLLFSTALLPASFCCFLAARTAARDEARLSELSVMGYNSPK